MKTKYKKIDKENVQQITTEEVDTKIILHIPDIENKFQQAKDEVERLRKLLVEVKQVK